MKNRERDQHAPGRAGREQDRAANRRRRTPAVPDLDDPAPSSLRRSQTAGIESAAWTLFQQTRRGRCMRNALAHAPAKQRTALAAIWGATVRPRALRSTSSSRQLCALSRLPTWKPDAFLLSFRRGADQNEDALRLRLHSCPEVDSVGPDADVPASGEVAVLPALVLPLPGDRFGASCSTSAESASWKSPVEMPRR